MSIGTIYCEVRHAVCAVSKPYEGTVLDRAMEAAAEKLKKKKATQKDVAHFAGIQQPSVTEWAFHGPRIAVAERFVKATNVCLEWLYTGRGPKRPPPPINTDLAKVYDNWERLDAKAVGRILEIVEGAADSAGDFRARRR
jgi:hypothetical protein